jgi:hypothetical protein
MFGAWNEHYYNHPAGLPVSQYRPNTNLNTGAAAVDAAWAAAHPAPVVTPPAAPPAPAPVAWNQWYQDFTGTPPTSPGTPTPAPTPSAGNPAQAPSFASQYTPAMQQQVYENPWYILPDVFQGIAPTSPLYQSLRDMGADPLGLYNTMVGSQGKTGNSASYIDWLSDFYKKQTQAAPSQASPQNLLSMIFGQQKFGADSPNTLGQVLGAGDMSTQIRTLYNLAKDATNLSMNPKTARAYQASLAQSGDTYGQQMLGSEGGTGVQNISQWIAQFAPWLGLGG